MSFDAECVEQSRPGKQGMVAGGQDACQNYRVDHTPCSMGTGHLENNGERRGSGLLGIEVWVVVGDVETDDDDRNNAN